MGFDGSAAARSALRFAVREASVARAPLQVLALAEHLAEHTSELVPEGFPCPCRGGGGPLCLDAAEAALADAARALHVGVPAGSRFAGSTALRFGPAAAGLLDAAGAARLVVVGRQGRQVRRDGDERLGAVARELVDRCPVPLALVPARPVVSRGSRRDDVGQQSVVVALGRSRTDERDLRVARDWAVAHRARLHVVHGLREPTASRSLGVTGAFTTVTHRPLSDAVLDVAASASLVVLSRTGTVDLVDLLTRLGPPTLLLPR